MVNAAEVRRLSDEFIFELNALYGLYLDTHVGFMSWVKELDRLASQPGVTLDVPFTYLSEEDAGSGHEMMHHTTARIVKERISEGGRHYFLTGRMLMVQVFELWEHHYRTPLATALGLQTVNDLEVPILGDIRLLRNDILHHKGQISEETIKKVEVLKLPADGQVNYRRADVGAIVRSVKAEINQLVVDSTGDNPGYATRWRLVPEEGPPKAKSD